MLAGLFSGFMVDTWAEATIMAAVAGTVGFFVVLRGSTFAAHAIPQGAFTGAAGAALVGVNALAGVGVFSLLGVLAIARWGRRGRHDVVTALALAALLGTGSLFLSMSREYSEQVFSLLFGEPLAVTSSELLPTAAIGAACVAVVVALYRPLVLSSVAPELAAAQGNRPELVELGFLLAVGAATTMALPVVGALLVFSLMIGPPAAARSMTSRPAAAMSLSAALALVTVWVSIAASFFSNWPMGFFVATMAAVWYGTGRALAAWGRPRAALPRQLATVGSV
ncbi:MAG: metal ABC transporter permease [Acidimicrobiales bacterium]